MKKLSRNVKMKKLSRKSLEHPKHTMADLKKYIPPSDPKLISFLVNQAMNVIDNNYDSIRSFTCNEVINKLRKSPQIKTEEVDQNRYYLQRTLIIWLQLNEFPVVGCDGLQNYYINPYIKGGK